MMRDTMYYLECVMLVEMAPPFVETDVLDQSTPDLQRERPGKRRASQIGLKL